MSETSLVSAFPYRGAHLKAVERIISITIINSDVHTRYSSLITNIIIVFITKENNYLHAS